MPEMTSTDVTAMQTLIRLVASGARKEDISGIEVDWNAVLPLAAEQHVVPIVACALLYSPGFECSEQVRNYLLDVMRAESSTNLIRRQRIMYLLQQMKNAGIKAKVIKGYAISECYAYPECRGSVDTDILIEVSQEAAAIRFFETHGFHVEPRAATNNHSVCQHKKYGVIELHIALYSELLRDNWFQAIPENELIMESTIAFDGFNTFGHTDQLIFLTLHMVKHFVLEGLTLRMMLDIALYFACHQAQINAERYWHLLRKLHYDKLVSGILWNMIRHGVFDQEDFPGILAEDVEQMQMILADLEQGGYMGVKQKNERLESGMEYNRQMIRKNQSVLQYRLHMLGWKIKSGTKYMFPKVKTLRKLYPITKKAPVTIPFMWVWQMVSFPIKKIASGALKRDVRSEQSVMSTVTKNRIAMFKELEML